VYFPAPQVRRATSLVSLATLAGLLIRASLLSCTASSPSHLARASCSLGGSAHPCEFTFQHRKFAEPRRSCLLQPWRVCSPVRVYFPAPQVRRATSLVPLAALAGLLTRASLFSCTASSPGHLARASCSLGGSAHPCEFIFLHRKFAGPPRSCLLQPWRVCSPVRVYFPAPQVRRATSLVPLAALAGLLTRASLFSCTASSPGHLARASCSLGGSAHPCEFIFLHRKFAGPPRSCLLQPWRVCSPVRVYFPAPQVRRATSLVPLAALAGLLTRASLFSCTASSPGHLARASCSLGGSAHPCEFIFLHRKFAGPPRSCLLQPWRVCSPVRVYFPAPQVRRATSLVPLAALAGLLTRASLFSCTASSPGHLARASCSLGGSAHPCEFIFLHRKFAGPPRSCLLQPWRVCSPVRVYFPAPQVRRATSLVPLAALAGLLTRASLFSCTASSPGHLARASCSLGGSAHPCEFIFLHRKFAGPPRSCLLQPWRVCSPVRVYFPAPQVRRATSLVPLAALAGLLTRASLFSCTASSPGHLARASCSLGGSAHPCEFIFLHRKFAGPPRSCLLQPWRVCSPVRVYFPAPQVRRATSLVPLAALAGLLTRASLLSCTTSSPGHLARASCNLVGSANPFRRATSLVPLATLAGLLTRASLLSCTASSPSHLARASCNLGGSANPCEFTFQHRKFAEPPRCASCKLGGSAYPCEFTFLHRKFAEPPRSCRLQPCRVCLLSCTASSLGHLAVPLANLEGLLTRASLLSCTASSLGHLAVPLATSLCLLTRGSLLSCTATSPSHLARPACSLVGSANPCECTFQHRKFAEPPRSCPLQPCRVCLPVRVHFPAPQVRRATSLVSLATLSGLLTRASSLSSTASSPSHLARVPCNLVGSAYPCEFTFQHRKFAEPPRSCPLQPCRVCLPVRVHFPAPQVRRATSLVSLATLSGLLTRASSLSSTASSPSHLARVPCNLVGSAYPCEFTFQHRKFAEPPRSCPLQPCRVCLPVRVHFPAPQVRRATSLVSLATLSGLLTRASSLSSTASSPSHLARVPCNLVGSAYPCEFTFQHRKFAEPPRSCPLQPCRVCLPVRVHFPAPQVRRATSLVSLATLSGLLTRASSLSSTASSPSHLARVPCNLVGSAYPCEFTFQHRKFAEPPRSCPLQPCRVCLPVRVHFPAPQVRRATSLVSLATLSGLLTRASSLSSTASSPSHLARVPCNLVGSAYPCEFTFQHRKFAEPPRSCPLQPCRVCLPVRVHFPAPQVRRATSLVSLATLSGLLTRASSLSSTASSPSHLARASCNLVGSANLWEFTFLHRNSPSHLAHASCNLVGSANPCEITLLHSKIAEPPRSCLLQPWRQDRRATSLVPLATLAGPLTRGSLLSCSASSPSHLALASCNFVGCARSPSHLARASCNLGGSANPCEFTFLHRKFAEPTRSCLLKPWRVC
ncbi:hypothetical protein CRG98_045165, partial [Punica granatum]